LSSKTAPPVKQNRDQSGFVADRSDKSWLDRLPGKSCPAPAITEPSWCACTPPSASTRGPFRAAGCGLVASQFSGRGSIRTTCRTVRNG